MLGPYVPFVFVDFNLYSLATGNLSMGIIGFLSYMSHSSESLYLRLDFGTADM